MIPFRKEDKTQLVTEPGLEMEKDKIVFKGSHPDSLYRVATGSGAGAGKLARALRILRWPAALVLVCVALAVFVYFLMPDNIDTDGDRGNATYWEPVAAGPGAQVRRNRPHPDRNADQAKDKDTTPQSQGTRTSEIDFYDAETDKSFDITSVIDSATETSAKRKLPIEPVFPAHITPEVQYGNEKADSDKLRTAKTLDDTNTLPEDSTLKPHITQKPEKPLEIYVKDGNGITTTLSGSETIAKAETLNDYTNYGEKHITKQVEVPKIRPYVQTPVYTDRAVPQQVKTIPPVYEREPDIPPEIQEFYQRRPAKVDVNFTSGHSKLFGISIEDAEKMRSTTQSSTYNTRVSPTLPTWRDGDDSTTKKYPVNVNYDVPQCRSTRLALCRGVLPYDLAGPAVALNGVEITALLPQIQYLIATNCSERVQHFMCALLEPECNPPPFPAKMPCYNLCKGISDSCEGLIPRELLAAFNCNQYSSSNCIAAKSPCHPREMACGDGTCIPRDWICDGAQDCPAGEDESKCVVCETNEFKCPSGGCILKRWMCDGYADCPEGEDEADNMCGTQGDAAARNEPGEESAGSAPAPAVRRPYRVSAGKKNKEAAGENDSSKELLVTSDSNNAFKRNFTRRPSLSRLSPYSRPIPQEMRSTEVPRPKDEEEARPKEEIRPEQEILPKEKSETATKKLQATRKNKDQKAKTESGEDVNVGDLGFFEDVDKEDAIKEQEASKKSVETPPTRVSFAPPTSDSMLTRLDKSLNKLEKVIDGAAMLRKAASQVDAPDSPETNSTTAEKDDAFSPPMMSQAQQKPVGVGAWSSAHASPCPSGELRCVDGRCITLAQLCDGTIDCSDHADEDNCYT